MKTKITGTTLPVLEIGLEAGDKIVAEPGEFSWMTDNVQLNTTAMTAGAKGILGCPRPSAFGRRHFHDRIHRAKRQRPDRFRCEGARPNHASRRAARARVS